MRVYTVLRPSVDVGLKSLDRTVFLSDGFCWPAFLFGPFWLLYHRIWLALIVVVVAIALLAAAVATGAARTNAEWIYIAIAALLGLEGGWLREKALARRGFMVDGLIVAPGRAEAESAYFHRLEATRGGEPIPEMASAAVRREPDVVGLFPQPKGLS
jgi:hypothetical protein